MYYFFKPRYSLTNGFYLDKPSGSLETVIGFLFNCDYVYKMRRVSIQLLNSSSRAIEPNYVVFSVLSMI